uniref:Uncharacterized protein n=1 Tax=Terrapene triunguis TaxID=2587831 RepID=A0A674KB99_9SAUR
CYTHYASSNFPSFSICITISFPFQSNCPFSHKKNGRKPPQGLSCRFQWLCVRPGYSVWRLHPTTPMWLRSLAIVVLKDFRGAMWKKLCNLKLYCLFCVWPQNVNPSSLASGLPTHSPSCSHLL